MAGATQAINPALYPKLPFDVAKDFTPVGLVAADPHVLVVSPAKFAVTSYREFIAKAKASTNLSYASAAIAATHLQAASTKKLTSA